MKMVSPLLDSLCDIECANTCLVAEHNSFTSRIYIEAEIPVAHVCESHLDGGAHGWLATATSPW